MAGTASPPASSRAPIDRASRAAQRGQQQRRDSASQSASPMAGSRAASLRPAADAGVPDKAIRSRIHRSDHLPPAGCGRHRALADARVVDAAAPSDDDGDGGDERAEAAGHQHPQRDRPGDVRLEQRQAERDAGREPAACRRRKARRTRSVIDSRLNCSSVRGAAQQRYSSTGATSAIRRRSPGDAQRTTSHGRTGVSATAPAVQSGTSQRCGTSASGESSTIAFGG